MGLCNADVCLEVLRLTPNLEGCTMSPYSPPRNPQSPVRLSHLRSITFRGDEPSFLDKLVVPELQELSVSVSGSPWTVTPHLISLFLQCSLQTLSFSPSHSNYPDGDHMIQLLQALPSLAELNLQGYSSRCMSESFLARFADHQDSKTSPLVPMLHTLKVDHTPSHFEIAEFVAAIQSRMTFCTLKKVEICLARVDVVPPFDETTLLHLQELRDIGLDIVYTKIK
jgi:hypothetical protein